MSTRTESDLLGERQIDADSSYGIHTQRALENFPLSRHPLHPGLVHAFGTVKLAALQAISAATGWDLEADKVQAMEQAAFELSQGILDDHIVVDPLQGGAGTSTNMNVNEVIANRALQIMGKEFGDYEQISPSDDVNRFQSTNDTYPTALKLAAINGIQKLEQSVILLQESFQDAEKRFANVVKVGRTQYQDSVLTTLGREMASYAEAFSRDRWRIYKCEERLRVVNLGGTAIGTGFTAPRRYIFQVVEILREITGIGFARAEDMMENTQNCDVFVEVSGIIKANASTLIKICNDLRLLSSGPEAGIGEIKLPAVQAGSSLMPGKVNPVIPEAVIQSAMLVIGYDAALTNACSSGVLELNSFLPLISHCLLESIDLLQKSCEILATKCVSGIEANRERCRENIEASTVLATALIPQIGYEKATEIARQSMETDKSVRELVKEHGIMGDEQVDDLITPEAVCRLGSG
ncbi:MAG: aspartate ammonia-lyase [Gammaproteobacteria bacterium]|nr:MAG: aspartate ammonia-lyase [Gammaproteobacteria bacterium]